MLASNLRALNKASSAIFRARPLKNTTRTPSQYARRQMSSYASNDVELQNCKKIGKWLFGVSGMVATIVTVGGVTRLTRSGLSMTDWRLQGSLPPMTDEEWDAEFERYKTFPEWQQRKSMTVEEFKFIYFWEYGHRMLGRFIGVAFAAPFAYFAAKKMIPKSLYPRLGLLFTMGGLQGLIGWWMVKSGLEMDPQQKKEIRVSPYRLATHLSMAFCTYSLLVWTALDLTNPYSKMKEIGSKMAPHLMSAAKKVKGSAIGVAHLVALTALSGAFVAGNDAGNAYNTFPKMGDNWVPDEYMSMVPAWRNFFEETATVQLDHRVLAISTLASIAWMYTRARTLAGGALWQALPPQVKTGVNACVGLGLTQVGLGISTLLMYVPVPLAAAHQFGSLALLTSTLYLASAMRFTRFAQAGIGAAGVTTAAVTAAAAAASIKTEGESK